MHACSRWLISYFHISNHRQRRPTRRLLLSIEPQLVYPLPPDEAAASAPSTSGQAPAASGPCLSATLLLERLPLPPGAAVAAGGPVAAAAGAACQVMVGVQLPGQQGGIARLAVVDEVFGPPGAGGRVGGASQGVLGKLQLPLHLLVAAARPAAAAAACDATMQLDSPPAGGGLLAGITAARGARQATAGPSAGARDSGQQGTRYGTSGAGSPQPVGRTAAAPVVLTVSVAFRTLDLVPLGPTAPHQRGEKLPDAAAQQQAAPTAEDRQRSFLGLQSPLRPAAAPTGSQQSAPAPPPSLSPLISQPPQPPPLVVHHLSSRPRLLLIDDFWDAAFCARLRAAAAPHLSRSKVASGNETPSRTSWSFFFVKADAEAPLIRAAEDSVRALFAAPAVLGSRPPLVKTEALQGGSGGRLEWGRGGRGGGGLFGSRLLRNTLTHQS
jgi:hypothetical protein